MSKPIQLSFRIAGESGPMFKPTEIHFSQDHSEQHAPFPCFSDVLTALGGLQLAKFQNQDIYSDVSVETIEKFWQNLDIGHQLFSRMQKNISVEKKQVDPSKEKALNEGFEKILNLSVTATNDLPVISLEKLSYFIDVIDNFEAGFDRPLIYNSSVSLSDDVRKKFITLYGFLYHLRSLIVLDYNSYLEDKSSDSIKMDRIGNYLPNPEYVVNDAIFWWKIKQTLKDFKAKDFEKYYTDVFAKCKTLAQRWIHNGFYLQASRPDNWYASQDMDDLQDELYNHQMQWLLGSDAGLLFKVREEAYALAEGYDKIFYPDVTSWNAQKFEGLRMTCNIDKKLVATAA